MSRSASRSTHSGGAGGRYAPCCGHQSAEARLPSAGARAAHLNEVCRAASREWSTKCRQHAAFENAPAFSCVAQIHGEQVPRQLRPAPPRPPTCSSPAAAAACRRMTSPPGARPAPRQRHQTGYAAPSGPAAIGGAGSAAACPLQQNRRGGAGVRRGPRFNLATVQTGCLHTTTTSGTLVSRVASINQSTACSPGRSTNPLCPLSRS